MKVNQTERWLRLALAAIVLLFAGVIYAWSILKAPFASEFGWDAAKLGTNYTITIVCFCLGGFFSGLLTKLLSAKIRMFISAALLFCGFFITSRLQSGQVFLLYVAYGVMSGLGVGFTYTTVIGITGAWFPDRKGLCSGIMMMCFGLTSLTVGNLATPMMNSEAIGWRNTYLILAIVIGVIIAVAAFVIQPPKSGTVFPGAKAAAGKKGKKAAAAVDYPVREMIRRASFWKLFILITIIAAVGSAAISFASDILGDAGADKAAIASIVGVLSICNGLGRLATGAMFDKLGARKTQYFIGAVVLLAPIVLFLATRSVSLPLSIIGLGLCFFAYGFAPTTSASFVGSFYGMDNFSLKFSIMNLILIPAPFASMLAGNLVKSSGSFTSTFMILIGCAVVGLFVNLSIKKA
ncbi:MAG: MFS transporter [Oscillospiraceae bacterium]|jgi:OFA family oxalate/formate antiporter-like MFS transporter|nr:MFS transporter [Oscillospiraceae bacterium]